MKSERTCLLCFVVLVMLLSGCNSKSLELKESTGKAQTEELRTEEVQAQEPQNQESQNQEVMAQESESMEEETEADVIKESENKINIQVNDIDFERISGIEIGIIFTPLKQEAASYLLMRRELVQGVPVEEFRQVASMDADKINDEQEEFIDIVQEDKWQQFEYRVDIAVSDSSGYQPLKGRVICASNVLVCIDPGHYAGKNSITGKDAYGYAEGDFTLIIAQNLRQSLKELYGIDSYMTRESGRITLDGYSDLELDSRHLSLRGEYAAYKDSDLFVSLHTNANEENANGYDTCQQPASINKTLVFVNQVGSSRTEIISMCNSIGYNLSEVNYRLGLSSAFAFNQADKGNIPEWTKGYNDSLDTAGSVVQRTGNEGDYYGVLRGAASVNKPGLIIEHGMHTVAEVRKAAMTGNLASEWATADAYGIAYGFGFLDSMERKR